MGTGKKEFLKLKVRPVVCCLCCMLLAVVCVTGCGENAAEESNGNDEPIKQEAVAEPGGEKQAYEEVAASTDGMNAMQIMAERFRSKQGDNMVDQNDYVFVAADYGGGVVVGPDDLFSYSRKEIAEKGSMAGVDVVVYDKNVIDSFFKDYVGLTQFSKLPEYTGEVNWEDDRYVFEKNDEIYIVIDGLGDPLFDQAELADYQENGDGTATAMFKRIDMDGATYTSKLVVQRNLSGGLQIVEYVQNVE